MRGGRQGEVRAVLGGEDEDPLAMLGDAVIGGIEDDGDRLVVGAVAAIDPL